MSRAEKITTPQVQPFATSIAKTPVATSVLLDILRQQRFAGTAGEQHVIDTYLKTIPGMDEDDYGNLILVIPTLSGLPSQTLFSCHTDTVEKKTATGTKDLAVHGGAMLTVAGGGVLGADDGTGIWLMLNLIAAKVPGTYIFHREEEIGGGGSTHIARHHPDWLASHKRAIAFDRKGQSHVITHQGMGRCCSDTFAEALAAQLNDGTSMGFAPNDGGTFTDTANYTDLIPECTNLSVGYYHQHTLEECQDLSFATHLAARLIAMDWENLPTERDPADRSEDFYYGAAYRDYGYYSRYADLDNPNKPILGAAQRDFEEMVELIADFPEETATILQELGYDAFELLRALKER